MPKDLFISELYDVYGNFLNEKQRMLIDYYYNDDLSLSEIAENVGITRQGVRDTIKRAEQQLYLLENSCGYCKKFLRLKELSKDISKNKDEIKDIIDSL